VDQGWLGNTLFMAIEPPPGSRRRDPGEVTFTLAG